jgi:hypothetical protein
MRSNVGSDGRVAWALVRAGNDGQVRPRFGNLTSADIGECTVSLSWDRAERAGPTSKASGNSAPQGGRRRMVTVSGPLRARQWTHSTVTFSNTRPSDITYVRLDELECEAVALR